ncbi:ATP-binding protein [Halalkalibacter nanhaiisediminis]|uniref:histidine kinase n=1 Tax=Halalkalibacter nanhaiisediminis TaxID=688079 RepID=A0A562QCV1_9BACI|nr:sensor histidine kinase [Halalkalibacter nanhaiisediminis]TWI53990.1 two-component system CitB family sensor kinase [Halalkalibacter nanhaiisediminis]
MIQFNRIDTKKHASKPNVKLTLKMKMILLIGLLIIGMFAIMAVFLESFFSEALENQVGERALSVAQSVANIPELKAAFELDDPASVIQPLVTPIREASGAEFIVVGNRQEIRYAHPVPELVGEKMVGEDNERAFLYGESYVSRAVGSLGPSLRGKVPVISDEEDVIGVVSVGFLVEDVDRNISSSIQELWYVLLLIAGIGIVGAILIAQYIKKVLFGLEPEEISYLFLQKETILQSAHEGIIAVNKNGLITLMNAAAERLLFEGETKINYVGKPIQEFLPDTRLLEVLESGESQYDREMIVGKHIVVVNRVPIYYEGTMMGAVSTFRNKTEMEHLTKELSRIKQYANALRAQTHEFTNKLYTILGLLQLDQKQEAVDFIRKESDIQQEWIRFLLEKVPDPLIGAILLGKLNQANELRVSLSIDPESSLTHQVSGEKREVLLTVLGNVIENAIEAVKGQPDRRIKLFFTDLGEDMIFEIEDSGPGVSEEDEIHIFEQGFSTKEGSHRGIGLALSKQIIADVGGTIFLEDAELGGACFIITIPKD